ncbi:MAG TPA: C-type lectin domain-containing protein [Kofleriaceae bacterium]|nr:C-type lectin domain-containing protein [Kofleriaceae bacterium]
MRSAVAHSLLAGLTVFAVGCGAQLGDGNDGADASSGTDAKIYRDAAVDSPPIGRACTGGTAAMTAPDGSCFVFVSTPVTYLQARAACQAMTAHLAYLKTAALDTAAEALIGAANTWIGANDMATEGTFVWDDGSALVFTNWHTGEPNSGGTGATYQEDCVIIAGARVDKQWDDRPCDATEIATSGSFAYLCQY